jgi:hypothetical protein
MERGFYHPQLGYWQTIADVPQRVLNAYPAGTVQVPLKPSGLHDWIDGAWRPIAPPPPSGDEVRAERARRLSESDWTQLPDAPPALRAAWAAYRQALRDVPQQPGFPVNVTWPSPPGPDAAPDPRVTGVDFGGVMISATAADQSGLLAVLTAIQMQGAAFHPTRFVFDNGSAVVITLENWEQLLSVWMPFRQSFFAVD